MRRSCIRNYWVGIHWKFWISDSWIYHLRDVYREFSQLSGHLICRLCVRTVLRSSELTFSSSFGRLILLAGVRTVSDVEWQSSFLLIFHPFFEQMFEYLFSQNFHWKYCSNHHFDLLIIKTKHWSIWIFSLDMNLTKLNETRFESKNWD